MKTYNTLLSEFESVEDMKDYLIGVVLDYSTYTEGELDGWTTKRLFNWLVEEGVETL